MRLFIAAPLPDQLRRRLAAIQSDLATMPLPVRWVRPEGIHLTFKFIGEVGADRVAHVEAALAGIGDRAGERFRMRAEGVGTFPGRGAPRVIWIGLTGAVDAAAGLARTIDAALQSIGIPPERRDFKPHLTLGRVKGRGRGDWRAFLDEHASVLGGDFEVSHFDLFESRLRPEGASYRSLASFALPAEGSS